MRKRTRAREFALQSLYQLELNTEVIGAKASAARDSMELVAEPVDNEIILHAEEIVKGILKNRESIDDSLTRTLTNWDINRLDVIDRSILRLSTYELFYAKDVPKAVVINEAVELAKKYGSKESSVLINGVLDKIRND